MKNLATTSIIVGLSVVLGLAYPKSGDKQEPDSGRYNLRWDANKIPLSVPGEAVQVSLPASAENYPWIVGIHIDDGKPGFASIMQVQMDDSISEGIRKPNAVVNVPAEKLTTAPGVISVQQGASGNENLIVYLVVPSGKKLILQNNAKAVTQFEIKTDTIIHNGVITAQKVNGLHTLISRLLITQSVRSTSDSSEVTKGRAGKYVALPKAIRSHLLSSVRPQAGEAALTNEGVILLKVEIDENGKVVEVSSSATNEKLASICIEAVKQWTFTPFEYEGNRVRVNAAISFYVGQGRVISSALGDTK